MNKIRQSQILALLLIPQLGGAAVTQEQSEHTAACVRVIFIVVG
ncbi:MAG: hypothetical protein ACXW1Z_24495 [Methylobacter sp.]